jgi:GT2 family glycosyltransferase
MVLSRHTHNLAITVRRLLHGLMLKAPQTWRTALSQSQLLTRVFVFFDNAKYEPILDAAAYRKFKERRGELPGSIPLGAYDYQQPEKSPETETQLARLEFLPLISILMPVYNTRAEWLMRAIASVQAQWYTHWELCIVDDHSNRPETLAVLGALDDTRIRIQRLEKNLNIVGASNVALSMAQGEYIALLDHDDELTPDALYEASKAINKEGAEFIYSDEDKLDEAGKFCEPHFKPDFSPDMLLAQNYMSHLGVMKKSLIERAGGFTPGTDGSQDYDLYLKVSELTDRIVHIPKVLYHWRKAPGSTALFFSAKSYAQVAGQQALKSAIERRGLDAQVLGGWYPGTYRVKYRIHGEPLISIIIPFKDKPGLLDMSMGSILQKSTYRNFEIIGLSNNSTEAETFAAMERLSAQDPRVRFHEHNAPFNFSEINNYGVRSHARGEHVVLLNNDIEIITPDWLESLLEFSQRDDVGAVGGKLYYPDGRLQHAGIILGIGGVAGHSHKYLDGKDHGYFSRPHIIQNLSALTAACFMVKRRLFEEVGGLDAENLQVAFNDVDFCLKLRERGYLNVFTPYCQAWHHESISRGYEDTGEKQERFRQEVLYMLERHAGILQAGDPYYSPNLTLEHENFSMSARAMTNKRRYR